tara:strand:- start:230 stop:427 length:198 start_codon:yes stop_codon:yes gene_type:complete
MKKQSQNTESLIIALALAFFCQIISSLLPKAGAQEQQPVSAQQEDLQVNKTETALEKILRPRLKR